MTRRPHRPADGLAVPRAPGRSERSPGVRGRPQRGTHTRLKQAAARDLMRTATMIMLALLAVAMIVYLIAPASARRLLSFAFPVGPPGLRAAWGIFTANLRLAAVPLASALLLRMADRDGPAFNPARTLLDAIIATILALNVMIVGAGFGAYGARMIRYALPHGPVELTGYCCALTVYASARAGHLQARQAWLLALASVTLLAVSAMLEAVASPI